MRFIQAYRTFTIATAVLLLGACAASSDGNSNGNNNQSTSGSTATMLPYKNFAYSLDYNVLKIIDLSQTPPALVFSKYLSGPETLFINNNHLYVGGILGVDIFNIEDPAKPIYVAEYEHMKACDPIIVQDDIGYITLRSGFNNFCRLAGPNRLEIVDMADPSAPERIAEFPMTNPYGLALTDTHLAVCEEAFGLTLLDVDQPLMVMEVAKFPAINCFDLIYQDGRLIATATDGIYQFAAESEFISLISKIPVGEVVSD